jgi:hypothetical protein
MKVFRCCLLLLLSLALPLQAALAAGMGGSMRHATSQPAPAPAQPHTATAAQGASPVLPQTAMAVDGTDCAQHHKAQDSWPLAADHDCSSCSWCSLGTSLPSSWQGWVAARAQHSHAAAPVGAYGAPTLRAPERPPRAIATKV